VSRRLHDGLPVGLHRDRSVARAEAPAHLAVGAALPARTAAQALRVAAEAEEVLDDLDEAFGRTPVGERPDAAPGRGRRLPRADELREGLGRIDAHKPRRPPRQHPAVALRPDRPGQLEVAPVRLEVPAGQLPVDLPRDGAEIGAAGGLLRVGGLVQPSAKPRANARRRREEHRPLAVGHEKEHAALRGDRLELLVGQGRANGQMCVEQAGEAVAGIRSRHRGSLVLPPRRR
jgi:hypothetical protein